MNLHPSASLLLLLAVRLAAQSASDSIGPPPTGASAVPSWGLPPAAAPLPRSASQATLDDLDSRVKVLERLREIDQEDATNKTKSTPVLQSNASGLLIRSADTAWSIRFRGVIRGSGAWVLHDENKRTLDQFQNQTVRLGFEGALARRIGYRIQADFSKGSVGLQDAYSDFKFADWAQLRVGKFQAPLGWERYQSPGDLPFLDRALPSAIAPNRDVGVQVSGEILDGRLQYAIAGVNGGADGSNINADANDDKDAFARLWTAPARGSGLSWLEGLGLGVAGSRGHHDGALASYRSVGGQTFFSWRAADSARGAGWRIAPQASWTAGPFWLWGEWVRSVEAVELSATATPTDSIGQSPANKGVVYRYSKTTAGAGRKNLGATAWQAGISWIATGEDASEKGPKPRHPFDGSENGGWGALELSARLSALAVDDEAFPVYADTGRSSRSALAWAIAANWHLVRGSRIQLAFERTIFDGGATYVAGQDGKGKDILALRDRKPENLFSVVASTSF